MAQKGLTRRAFLRFSAFGIASGLLAACAPKAPAVQGPPTSVPAEATAAPEATAIPEATAAPSTEAVTLRWLDWADQDDIIKMAQDAFKEKYPNVTVNWEPIDEVGDKQLQQMISGTAPDILTGWDGPSYMWAEVDQLLDLNPLVDRDLTKEQVADFFPYQWNGLVHPATKIRMGLPYYPWTYLYYYNKEALAEAGIPNLAKGWTVDDYSAMLEKLVTKDSSGKITRWGGVEACYDSFRFQLWMHIFGGRAVDPNDWTQCVLSSEQSKAAMEWHRERIWDTNTLAQRLQVENKAGLDLLAMGQVVITGQGNGDMLALLQNPPGFEWAVAAPPVGSSGKNCGESTIDNWGIWKGTKAPDVAWEFLKLLALTDEIDLAIAALWGNPPNRISIVPGFKDRVKELYPQVQDDQLDPQTELILGGDVAVSEHFKKEKATEELLAPVLEQIFTVGDTPVSAIDAVCEQITELNRKEE